MGNARRSRESRSEDGLALIATIFVMVVMAGLIAAAMVNSMQGLATTSADYRSSRTFYAAEAAAEAALSAIERALDDGILTDAELAAISPPPLDGFDFSEFGVYKQGTIVIETMSDGPFAGLYSLTQSFIVEAKASDQSNSHASIVLAGKAQAIPVFQFGWFYEGGGSFGAGGTWHGYGRAHANGDLYLIGCDSYFHEVVTTAGKLHRDGLTKHRPLGGGVNLCPIMVYIDDAAADGQFLSFDSDVTPDPDQFKLNSEAFFDSRLMTDAHGVDSLKLPLPDGVPPREIIRPREASDTEAEKNVKYSWKADMYVTVDLDDLVNKNVACGGSPPANAPAQLPRITIVRDGGTYTQVPDDARKCAIFRFRWESYFDNHEEGWVDVLDVDIGQLRDWIVNDVGDGSEIVYVEFQNVGATPQDPGTTDLHINGSFQDKFFPVLRLINGAELHGPLSIGGEYTTIVRGDYNTIDWKPAAIFGDIWGVMSNAWSDTNVGAQTDTDFTNVWCRFRMPWCPPASHTTQNHAVLVGVGVGNTDCFHEDPNCPAPLITPWGEPYHAAGGLMLESWRNSTYCSDQPQNRCLHTWRGSYVALFAPETVSPYSNMPARQYYYPPNRDHAFEARFQNPDSLPPGTPMVGQVFRAAFREAY